MFNHGIRDVQALLAENGNYKAEFNVDYITVFLATVKDAETLEAENIRQQLFDNLQPDLQDVDNKYKSLILSINIYEFNAKELLHR